MAGAAPARMRPNAQQPSLRPPRALVARVRRFIVEHGLIEPGARVLAAVSGGPDSTCLLLTLAALRSSLRFELRAAYFDHGLRGERAAGRERRYVERLAVALDVPFQRGGGDTRALAARRKLSLEEAARELRYGFLARAARKAGCAVVAAGHTKDDQTETVLLHLLRGSGLRGLAGIAPSAAWPVVGRRAEPPRLVRPLLVLSRTETEACCRETGFAALRDPTNRSRAYLRNRVRHELLPALRRYNPRVEDALARLAAAAAADVEALETLAVEAIARGADGTVRLDRRRLASLPPALRRHAVRFAVAAVVGDARGLTERHVAAVLRAAAGPTGARLDLPRGLRVEVRRDAVVLAKGRRPSPRPLPQGQAPLPVPGTASFGPWRIEAKLLARAPRDLASGGGLTAYLDATACGSKLSVRRRRAGDRFHPLGLSSPKKLQDFLVDAHVPRAERDALPLVCSERGIAWVAGLRVAEWAKVTPQTRRVLRLRADERRHRSRKPAASAEPSARPRTELRRQLSP